MCFKNSRNKKLAESITNLVDPWKKNVVQENCVKSLHSNWKPLEQEETFAIFIRTCCDAPIKFAQDVESSLIEKTMCLNGHWVIIASVILSQYTNVTDDEDNLTNDILWQ